MRPLSLSEIAEDVLKSLHIDKRFVVFEWIVVEEKPKGLIKFTVSSDFARERITEYFSDPTHARLCRYDIVQIPEQERYAIARVSVVQVMAGPTYRSEQVTQMLLGEGADLLQTEGQDWARVRLHLDGYIGWVSRNQIAEVTPEAMFEWIDTEKTTPKRFIVPLRAGAETTSAPVGEFIFGAYLPLVKKKGKAAGLLMPDGTTAWADAASLKKPVQAPKELTSERIIETARMFLGVPYVWGGRSVKGFDCSGFVQTVFRFNGIELPRDASLQWKAGSDAGKKYSGFAEGDLLFFGPTSDRITHVAISMGEDLFIHESGDVHCSSLKATNPLYSQKYAQTLQGARRLGMVDTD